MIFGWQYNIWFFKFYNTSLIIQSSYFVAAVSLKSSPSINIDHVNQTTFLKNFNICSKKESKVLFICKTNFLNFYLSFSNIAVNMEFNFKSHFFTLKICETCRLDNLINKNRQTGALIKLDLSSR